ncbi:YdcF family protein [Paludibaculum fermentans]|uniref:YdcF family protein n=1 Tax=Paludibaculum fermentans TaxID=1473598 RepID=A0A7S7NP46_PALFE|nr:YdcF family protein [Paludibaculum fermentans]QOY87207.1 YdcF family protein [Paludibaculum fermentans]
MNISRTNGHPHGLRHAPAFFLFLSLLAQAAPRPAPLTLHHPVQDKNFYLLSSIEQTPSVRALIQADPGLAQLAAAKRAALADAPRACAADVECYAKAMRWSDDEIAQARAAFTRLAANPAMARFVEGVLRPSGMFQRYSAKPSAALLETAWEDAARKMNRAIDLFAIGQSPQRMPGPPPSGPPPQAAPGAPAQPPRGPRFDLTSYDVKSPAFARMVQIMAGIVGSDPKSLELFFQPSLKFSIELLLLHGHDEAGRHEPLESGENRAALARIATTPWANYPYTVIVVLGNGPERDGVALAPVGRLRLMLAVREFREKKAPFLLVTGGYVHPNLTPYSEAMEMKKALRTEFGIPEDAILVDPQARRTTTNLRNAARLIFRYGIPADRKGLILTDQLHSATIETPAFLERCVRDFGYEPVRLLSRISPFDLEFTPLIDSLHADATDLLDP